MNKNQVLLTKNFVVANIEQANEKASSDELGTVISNLVWYGFTPSNELYSILSAYSSSKLADFWTELKSTLDLEFKEVLNAEKGVVYKNFPSEVLNKTESEYWIAQILMYLGVPSPYFAEEKEARPDVSVDLNTLKVLKVAKEDTLSEIYDGFKNKKVSLTPEELKFSECLVKELNITDVNISEFNFKMNAIAFLGKLDLDKINVSAKNATDILRYAAVLSGAAADLKSRITKFKLNRPQRRTLLKMFCEIKHFEEDIAARKETFKALFKALKPGDYGWAKPVSKMYDQLYRGKIRSFNGKVDLSKQDEKVFSLLKNRPGLFIRRFHEMYAINAEYAVEAVKEILNELTVLQLIKFKKYITTINNAKFIIGRPNASWEKAKLIENKKSFLLSNDIKNLSSEIDIQLKEKLNTIFPEGIYLDSNLENVKLPSNDQEISIGRGTVIDIPENIKFLRSASYWETEKNQTIYFDNSWNFIMGNNQKDTACCWNHMRNDFSVFSGDPVIQTNENKVAAQVIDVDLEKAMENGCKFAIWSILSYSHINFLKAEKAYGILQFLEDSENGEIFEPSKVDIKLDVKINAFNKVLVLVDIKNRKLIYLDMAFPGMSVRSAMDNRNAVKSFMPVLFDYLNTIPSVKDVMEHVKEGDIPFLFSDEAETVKGKAYVFKEVNKESEIESIDLQKIIS